MFMFKNRYGELRSGWSVSALLLLTILGLGGGNYGHEGGLLVTCVLLLGLLYFRFIIKGRTIRLGSWRVICPLRGESFYQISYRGNDVVFQKVSILLEKGINFNINESAKQILDECCTFIDFPKGINVLLQGDSSSSMYFIVQGLVRGYYIDEKGNDVTKCFTYENDFFSTECFRTNSTSSFNIECLEDCKCIRIPYEAIRKAMDKDNDILKVFNRYALSVMEDLEKRARDFVMTSAEERYKLFLEKFLNLNQRVNQKYIASYIGIRESSLSRIKKSIKD